MIRTVEEIDLSQGGAWAGEMRRGQVLSILSKSGVSVVAFNRADVTERFDQARTKVYNMKLWLDAGDKLFSKLNNPMLAVIEDGFRAFGRHDLQLGHGLGAPAAAERATEGLARVLNRYRIEPHDMPMPLNAFQHAEVDVASGVIRPTPVRAPQAVPLLMKAEMDIVVAAAVTERPEAGEPATLLTIMEI